MKKLIEGVLRFQNEVFPQHRELYQDLSSSQSPRWLLITCSDSRIVPSLIAQVGPGELFVCRNAGNIVPAHGESSGGVAATIEYAVQILGVLHIIVCGHSDCGAMQAVLRPENVADLPAVARWIAYADRARAVTLETHPDAPEDRKVEVLTQENVLAQLDNLRTLPSVAAKLRAGALEIHGWTYDIRSGGFLVWDAAQARWRPMQETVGGSGNAAA
ncbi:MAG: carbonic anhydrase [Deltaproteobacteria bacterium]|nr:carbonic anhydrase [Deltaproteobacteria bacterium]